MSLLSWLLLGRKVSTPTVDYVSVAEADRLHAEGYRVNAPIHSGRWTAYNFDGWARQGYTTQQAAWCACRDESQRRGKQQ